MSTLYDAIETSVQLGANLNNVASVAGGGPNVLPPLDVPLLGPSGVSDVAGSALALCEHLGHLYTAFAEADYDGSTTITWSGPVVRPYYAARGPYVKKYDSVSDTWTLVGSAIEPTLTESYYIWSNSVTSATGAYTLSTGGSWPGGNAVPVGTRFLPSHVNLASDGTDLYLSYAIHISFSATSGTYSPLVGIIRKYNTGTDTWDLFGQIDQIGDNDRQSSLTNQRFDFFELVASSHDPGACYAALTQTGIDRTGSSITRYASTVTRFDGSSLAGTIKTIGTPTSSTPPTSPFTMTDGTFVDELALRFDEATGPWIYWTGFLDTGTDPFRSSYVQRWSDMTITASFPAATHNVRVARGYEAGTVLVDTFDSGLRESFLREMPFDGSTAPAPIDGASPEIVMPTPNTAPFGPQSALDKQTHSVLVEPPNNIWVVNPDGGALWLYHRPCRDWTLQSWTPVGGTFPIDSGAPAGLTFQFDPAINSPSPASLHWSRYLPKGVVDSLLVDGVIYVAAWLFDEGTDGTIGVTPGANKLAVYATTIHRDVESCGPPTSGVHIHQRFGSTS